jgi:ribosomal protein S25
MMDQHATEEQFVTQAEALRDLTALEEIERNPSVSQRELAQQLGVSLGVANACIRTLARKGFVKIRGESNRSITYHLTKTGLLRKSLLAMEWTRNTVDFYAQARRRVSERLRTLGESGARTVVLYGTGEMAEIAAIVAPEAALELTGIVDQLGTAPERLLGVPVGGPELLEAAHPDAVVLCVDPDAEALAALRATSIRLFRLVGSDEEGE